MKKIILAVPLIFVFVLSNTVEVGGKYKKVKEKLR